MSLSFEKRHLCFTYFHQRPSARDNIVGLVRNIQVNTTQVGNSGGALTPLHTFNLPAGSLRNDGDYLSVWYSGNYAANANSKTLQASAGGTTYELTAGIAPGASGWAVAVKIVRLSSTSILVSDMIGCNDLFGSSATPAVMTTFGDSAFFASRNKSITGLPNLNTNPLTLTVSGQGVANNDVFQNLSIIEIVQN
jgi:hypothetical protein